MNAGQVQFHIHHHVQSLPLTFLINSLIVGLLVRIFFKRVQILADLKLLAKFAKINTL